MSSVNNAVSCHTGDENDKRELDANANSTGGMSSVSSADPIQLYRPANTCTQIEELLTRQDLSNDDILSFLSGSDLPPPDRNDSNPAKDKRAKMRKEFHQRRAEIQELSEHLNSGEARIDEDGRLVPTEPPRPPRANLPPPPPPGRNQQANFLDPLLQGDEDLNGLANGIFDDVNAADVGGAGGANLTFRRICFAVLAVVTAFVCVILQTLPLLQPSEAVDPNFDQLLHELLHVRFLKQHLRYCPDLDRQPPVAYGINATNIWSYRYWQDRTGQIMGFYSETDCNDGVIHIPSKHVLANSYIHSTPDEAALLQPFRYGVDKVWHLPCYASPDARGKDRVAISRCYPGWKNASLTFEKEYPKKIASSPPKCFRGVHDDIISKQEIEKILRLGNYLILNGADHFDIHYEVAHLQYVIPTVVEKLQNLLQERYHQSGFQPVAFRIQTAGPMDFMGVNLFQTQALALNQTTYLEWIEKCKRQNEMALYSLPWPFRVPPVRDTCNLMADLEADPRFAIHTSVFLGNGAGMEYRGGVILFADNHVSNYKPKHKMRRGVTIDGSKGRVVVSSGGIENRRCRMPTRAGLRTVLQIWWDCSSTTPPGEGRIKVTPTDTDGDADFTAMQAIE